MGVIPQGLTNDAALSVTDRAPEESIAERKLIWDNQINYLISVIGAWGK
ncbi:hypothetical protein KXQ82_00055 [Mucilaginibacter sp. HMF5004]|nr:START-like domain-containing protein [Mucilaginibacter rivuli]MBW4888077.1 hypothetical protein [Mucilaginibacter rivuli]